jgi:hypothetical protein
MIEKSGERRTIGTGLVWDSSRPLQAREGRRMAGVEGLEPPACWFEARRSIQLSYTPVLLSSVCYRAPVNLGT